MSGIIRRRGTGMGSESTRECLGEAGDGARRPDREHMAGFPIARLNAFFAALPRLGEIEADAFLEDLIAVRDAAGRASGEAG